MPDFSFENACDLTQGLVLGTDEVGRGPLAGPVAAAAVCFPDLKMDEKLACMIKDSKQLTKVKRQLIFDELMSSNALIGIGLASAEEIDEINILQVSFLAMKRAIRQIEEQNVKIGTVLVDGNRLPKDWPWPAKCIVKGDSLSLSVAAASIIAKVTRDGMMEDFAKEYPFYDWENNAGYGTKKHLEGLKKYGVSPLHRRTFAPVRDILQEDS